MKINFNIKDFLKPELQKILLFILLFFITPSILTEIQCFCECKPGTTCICQCPKQLSPPILIILNRTEKQLYLITIPLAIIFDYLLSCLIILIYKKVK